MMVGTVQDACGIIGVADPLATLTRVEVIEGYAVPVAPFAIPSRKGHRLEGCGRCC